MVVLVSMPLTIPEQINKQKFSELKKATLNGYKLNLFFQIFSSLTVAKQHGNEERHNLESNSDL